MPEAVITTDCPNLRLLHRGKVRDMYEIPGHEAGFLRKTPRYEYSHPERTGQPLKTVAMTG